MNKPRLLFADIMNRSDVSSNSLAILCVAASASRHSGVDVVIDSFPLGISPSGIAECIREMSVDFVGFSSNALNEYTICEVIANLKELGKKPLVGVGGPSASYSPQISRVADFVVHGEGENSVYDLVSIMAEGAEERLLSGELHVAGITTGLGPHSIIEQNLSDLSIAPSPFVPSQSSKQFLPVNGTKYLYWETTRGCSFNCAFCCYSLLSSKFRSIPKKRLMAEIDFLKENCTEHLFVTDSVLGGKKERTKEMLRLLTRLEVPKSVRLRGEYIDPELAELLHRAKISYLDLGLQTTNPAVSWARTNDIEAMLRSLAYLREVDVQANIDLIVGFPGETVDTMRESIRFVIEDACPNSIKIFPLKIYPGTIIEAMAKKKGKVWITYDPVTYDTHSSFSFGSQEFAELVTYANATGKLYRFLSDTRQIDAGRNRKMHTFDRFFEFLKQGESSDMDAFLVLHMPQNSHATESVRRLWDKFHKSRTANQ